MPFVRAILKPVRVAGLAAALACCAHPAVGQTAASDVESVDVLRDRFPPSSIDSVPKADAALRATGSAKPRVEKDFKAAAGACLGNVLVNACLDDARTKRRQRMNDIDAIELEANRYKRRDRAERLEAERNAHEAERTAKAPADAEARERNRKAYESRQTDAAKAAAERARNGSDRSKPSGRGCAGKSVPPADAEIHAAQRAKNASDYAKKRKDAQIHLVEVQRRLVEKAADDKRRADAKAAKDAKDARTAAAAKAAADSDSVAVGA